MKTYHLLEPTDIIQDGDMFPSTNRPIAPERMRPIPEDYYGKQADVLLVFRPVPELQWQTGDIPFPKVPSILVLERHNKVHEYTHCNPVMDYDWYGITMPDGRYTVNQLVTPKCQSKFGLTGRWYIQEITLPAPTVSGDQQP